VDAPRTAAWRHALVDANAKLGVQHTIAAKA
jgi:hypothetical protein